MGKHSPQEVKNNLPNFLCLKGMTNLGVLQALGRAENCFYPKIEQ